MRKPPPKTKARTKTKKNKSSFFVKILMFFTYVLLLNLLLSLLSRYISPESIYFPAFWGLVFPYLFIFTLLIFLLWLIFRKRISLYIFIVLALSTPVFLKFFNFFPEAVNESHSENIKVMSYNVRVFNLWNPAKDTDKFKRRNDIFEFIKEEKPDIICLQEVYFDSLHNYKTIDTLKKIQDAKYLHAHFSSSRKEHHFGLATLSKFPVVNKGHIKFPGNLKNSCIYTDILFETDTLRVYNAHFSSIGLSQEDVLFIENIGILNFEDNDSLHFESSIKKITSRLKNSFITRTQQVNIVNEHMSLSPYPTILCTDLNDLPSSYAYRKASQNLNDAFLTSGSGFGKTYIVSLPFFRIDYIFYSDFFMCSEFKVHDIDLSDHYPITANLLKKNK